MIRTDVEWILTAVVLRIFTLLSAGLSLLIDIDWIRSVIFITSIFTWVMIVVFSEFRNPLFRHNI